MNFSDLGVALPDRTEGEDGPNPGDLKMPPIERSIDSNALVTHFVREGRRLSLRRAQSRDSPNRADVSPDKVLNTVVNGGQKKLVSVMTFRFFLTTTLRQHGALVSSRSHQANYLLT